MTRIVVVGGTGYAGAAIVAEAAKRGHEVTAISRSAPKEPVDGVTYVQGSGLDESVRARTLDGADVVVTATSPRGDMAERQLELTQALAVAAAETGARFIVVGGFSSLRPAPGAPRFIEGDVPEEYRVEAHAGHSGLEWLLEASTDVDWTFVSPAAQFGSWVPGEVTGAYRVSDDVALLDESGSSSVSAADFALAIVDFIDKDEHRREHVSVVN